MRDPLPPSTTRQPTLPIASCPPTLVVHDAADLRLAIAAAQAARLPRLRLLSAPSAACFLGPAWWRALIDGAHPRPDGLIVEDMLDCGDAAGRALEALRIGQRALVLDQTAQWPSVAERANALGAILLDHRPAALDLAARGAKRHLTDWLANADDSHPASG